MAFRVSLIVSFVIGVSACSNSNFTRAIADPLSENRAVETSRQFDDFAAQRGITGKDLASIKLHAMTIAATRERLALHTISKSCGEDIQRFCPDGGGISTTLKCIKATRDQVSGLCETALRKEFGGQPTIAARQYLGISIPIGSVYLYGSRGNVRGVIAAENIKHNGIHFKKGAISFNTTGVSVGKLVSDQYIDGIKYLASGLGPFFNEDGDVVNATLAQDTEIGGIVYMGGHQVTFHSRGRVQSGRVAQETTVQGEPYIAGDRIWFNRDGVIKYVENKLNLHKPEPKAADKSSLFVGKTFITSRVLAYQTGLPRYHEVNRYIRDNSFTLFSDEVDRRITEIRNSCSGCMGPDRLTTPIRVEYIPRGTSITVMGEYVKKSNSLLGSDIRMLIVRDDQGHQAEISESSFKWDIAKKFTARESREVTAMLRNIESFKKSNNLRMSFCLSSFVKNSPDPDKFIRDFQMDAEVEITSSDAMCDGGYIFEFKTVESYLTSNYYFKEWGLFGKWSLNLSKPAVPKSLPRPSISSLRPCSISLSDIRKEGNCPGPKCDLSKFCESSAKYPE